MKTKRCERCAAWACLFRTRSCYLNYPQIDRHGDILSAGSCPAPKTKLEYLEMIESRLFEIERIIKDFSPGSGCVHEICELKRIILEVLEKK